MSYRPLIKRDQFHDLEIYWFRLLSFINSVEYKDLELSKQRKIMAEFNYFFLALEILGQLFNQQGKGETRVVAWRDEASLEYLFKELRRLDGLSRIKQNVMMIAEIKRKIERLRIDDHIIYHFSCIRVAAQALDCNSSKVSAVCSGKRSWTGGYRFMYENEYMKTISDESYLNKLKACPTV